MIRVVVVDDSGIARRAISDALRADGEIDVVATAVDAASAMSALRTHRPDVATFDVEMPGMDGITLLETLMRTDPLPVIIISSTTQRGSQAALRALEVGAVEVLAKPSVAELPEFAGRLVRAVRAASMARVRAGGANPSRMLGEPRTPALPPATLGEGQSRAGSLIALGASTGGTEAIASILARMPASTPGLLIVQHLPAAFTASFAKRLNGLSAMQVSEAVPGEAVQVGHAPTSRLVGKASSVPLPGIGRLVLVVEPGPLEHYQCPAADVLFRSCAQVAGRSAIGVLLTGMGQDGASGLLAMRQAGATTIAQDEASSVVYGMPRAAVELGAACEQCSLEAMPERMLRAAFQVSDHPVCEGTASRGILPSDRPLGELR